MKNLLSKIYFLFVVSIFVFGCTQPVVEKAKNPIIWADVPDIAIIRVDDTYYMSSTTMHMSPGLPIMKSKDLANWEMLNYAYDTLCDNDDMNLENGRSTYGAGSWASSLRYHNGTYYVTTFAATSGKTHIYTTTDIESGDWKERTFEPALHDHTLFFDDDDKVYMIYGCGKIHLVELNSDFSGLKEDGVNQVIIENAGSVAGGKIGLNAEGSQLIKKDGYYYLFQITWPQQDMRTEIVHRAKNITGPYEGRVFVKDRGIAQGSVVETLKGDWYAYMFRDFGAVGRIPYLLPMEWVDGWPVISGDGKAPEYLDIAAVEDNLSNIVASDEFKRAENEPKLPLAWQWNHNPNNDFWTVDEREGFLRLKTSHITANVLSAKNTLTQRTFGPESSAYTSVDVASMKDGDYAGIIALQKFYGFVGVKVDGDKKYIIMETNQNDEIVNEVESVLLEQDNIFLRIDCDFNVINENLRNDKAYFYYSLDGVEWIKIGETLNMQYTLPHFMGYRFGLFNYATKDVGGFVDFDFYRIEKAILTVE